MTKRRRQLGATLAIALVLTPLMTPIAHARSTGSAPTTVTSQPKEPMDSKTPISSKPTDNKQTANKGHDQTTTKPTDKTGKLTAGAQASIATGSLYPLESANTQLAPGITENRNTFTGDKQSQTVMHKVTVDLKDAELRPGLPDDGDKLGTQTVREEANAAIKHGHNVVAAVNADFFSLSNGAVSGPAIKDGKVIQDFNFDSTTPESYLGVLNNGLVEIGDHDKYLERLKNHELKHALGGLGQLVVNGEINSNLPKNIPGNEHAARSAVGITKERKVFFVSVDGAQAPYSDGMSIAELAKTMKDQGAVQALNLDGGGSTTYVSRTPGQSDLSVKNRPSDGSERKISTSWQIVSKATADGKLDHANVTPNEQAYVPKATIDFKATGVDNSGAPADLPSTGTTWSLNDDSFGRIDAQGHFKSTGKSGDVTAQLKQGDKILGEATVTIVKPNSFKFTNKQVSMTPGETKSLGLQAKANGRDVHLTSDVIKWNVPEELGTITDLDSLKSASVSASGTISVTLNGTDLKASVTISLGQLPKTIFDFENGIGDWVSTHSTNGKEKSNITIADTNNGGQVRFGKHALKVGYDFSTSPVGPTYGSYAGPEKDATMIPGTPKSIGMWVYATPEVQGAWIRMLLSTKNKPAGFPLDFVDQSTGIDWVGWKYVEAQIPDETTYPISISPKMAIKLMSVGSGKPGGGPLNKGKIYVDNIRAVYGTNKDDLTSPIIDSVDADGKDYTQADPTITVKLHDDKSDPNMTGIDWHASKVMIDNQDLTVDSHLTHDPDGSMTVKGKKFINGTHHLVVMAVDKFGNVTTKDTYFTVKTSQNLGIHLNQLDKKASLGGTARFSVTADDMTKLKSGKFAFKLAPGLTLKEVEYADSNTSNQSKFDSASNTWNFTVDKMGSDKTKPIMTVTVGIDRDTPADQPVTYQMTSAEVSPVTAADTDTQLTAAAKPQTIALQSDFHLKHTPIVTGLTNSITVLGADNKPTSGVNVTAKSEKGDSIALGQSDKDGNVATDKLTAAGRYLVSTDKAAEHGYQTATLVYAPGENISATPSHLLTGSTQDPMTQKTITWMTAPTNDKPESLMQIATEEDYASQKDKAFSTNQKGHNSLFTYDADAKAVTINRVDVSGLKPGVAYAYRVGDGTHWSNIRHFTTMADNNKFSFNVFGDTQVGEWGQLGDFGKFLNRVEASSANKPVFAIHVGDFNDNQTLYTEAEVTSKIFDQHPGYDSMDMIHVMGNHEYMGDDGSKSVEMLGVPNGNGPKTIRKGTYSVDYGNMHIASIGWTDNPTEMKKEMDWLRQDMQKSNKTWRIVTTHQPAYNKNPADARSSMFNKMLPPVCDELGIDVVFSGHDHSYGRTFTLKNGKKSAQGTTYIAAGHTGAKTYDIQPNQPEVWDMIQTEAQKKQKTFLTVNIDGNKLHLKTVDQDNTLVDQADLTAMKHTATIGNNGSGSNAGDGSKPGASDKATLGAKVKDAEKLKAGDYTAESFKAFTTALTKVKQVLNNPDATAAEVKAANLALIKAQADLKPAGTTPSKPEPSKPFKPAPTNPIKPEPSKPVKPAPAKPNKPQSSKPTPDKPVKPTTSQSTKPVKPATNKVPAKVIAVKSLVLYHKPNFSKGVKMNSFSKMPRMYQSQFQVLGTVKAKNGRLRFHVKDINKHSKTYKQTGYITAASSYVQSADYTAFTKRVTVINTKGLNSYKSVKLTGTVKHHYRQGQVLKVKRLIHRGQSLVFMLTNGTYITANKQQVQAGKIKLPKTVKTKRRISLYKEAELVHHKHSITANTTLKVTGWDYSKHGVLRYKVAGGYITANHNLVK
ncbi:MAG TPA: phosphodiester glycosidase family protein [Candidatus Levilactobacillus faecigallinarum]|uniref:Phosphodiester glycosidase family protein n=1 Tax=Candidatus Levilactobacillus faecigallinarum TaxID=2838638 RepID=A0A9D1QQJ4_9LACO|nr:phosphodiester glycosidase family protein [Candidatus Levilactobacillus faecigallinarum]